MTEVGQRGGAAATPRGGWKSGEIRGLRGPGRGVEAARGAVRREVTFMERDRVLTPDITAVASLIRSGALVGAVEAACGTLR